MNSFYKTQRWKSKREKILRRDEYLCQECKRYSRTIADGEPTPATTVHHIHQLEQHPEWALQNWNLVSMCCRCHDSMHDRNTGELTGKGQEWADRTPPP